MLPQETIDVITVLPLSSLRLFFPETSNKWIDSNGGYHMEIEVTIWKNVITLFRSFPDRLK